VPHLSGTCAPFVAQPAPLLGFRTQAAAAWSTPRPLVNAYRPDHRYAYPRVTGAGEPLGVRVMDYRVWDNFGRFKIVIQRR